MKTLIDKEGLKILVDKLYIFAKKNKIQSLDVAIIDDHFYASGYIHGAKVVELRGIYEEKEND